MPASRPTRPAVVRLSALVAVVFGLLLGLVAAIGPGTAAAAASVPGAGAGSACDAFPGAYRLPGADGVSPAAWSGNGLVVPACGPAPWSGGASAPVYAYPGALWTAGYQCVEFTERYLYDRYGVTMGIATNGDQVAAHYAAGYPGLFMIIKNGTPHRAPAAGDVLSLSADPDFDSASGGHSAVVQSSAVDAAGNGTVTVIEENASAAGVEVIPVDGWTVRYSGFPFLRWLTTAGLTVTAAHPPTARAGRRYSFTLTATGGRPPYRWRVTSGALPSGLTLSAAGALTGTPDPGANETETAAASMGIQGPGAGPAVTVAVTDARGATATAALPLVVRASPPDARRPPGPRRDAVPVRMACLVTDW